MEHRRPSLIGPLILITIGVLFLLANLGYLSFSFWEIAARFWPLILVLIGIEILFGRRSWLGAIVILVLWVALIAGVLWLTFAQGAGALPTSAGMTEQITQSLGDIQSATVDLDVGVSAVFVTALNSDTSNLMEGKFSHTENTHIVKTYSNGRLALKEQGASSVFPVIRTSRWDVAFYPQIPLTLRVNGGVGRINLDLSALTVTALEIDAGVGSVLVTTPQTGALTMRVNGGVGNTTITIPPSVTARIRVDGGLGGTRVDEARFPKSGNTYTNADYASATNKADIVVNGGVGSITIR